MNKRIVQLLVTAVLVSGCSSYSVGPIDAGKNSYVISKQAIRFAENKEELLASVFEQANQVCSDKKRTMKVEHLNEYSSFFGGEFKATLVFNCAKVSSKTKVVKTKKKAKTSKADKVTKTSNAVTKDTFQQKTRLLHYSM